MELKKITYQYEEYASLAELSPADRDLINHAIQASEQTYSPYSSFRVGAAVRLSHGNIVTGNNQENAAYPSGLCAERVALFYAQSQFPESAVESIAIYASTEDFTMEKPVTPCGACRQVMAEYEFRHQCKARIIMANGNGQVQIVDGIENLLPLAFYLEELKKGSFKI
ncbi:MAG: cytidine deaminase [Bacteroidales bacterium]